MAPLLSAVGAEFSAGFSTLTLPLASPLGFRSFRERSGSVHRSAWVSAEAKLRPDALLSSETGNFIDALPRADSAARAGHASSLRASPSQSPTSVFPSNPSKHEHP